MKRAGIHSFCRLLHSRYLVTGVNSCHSDDKKIQYEDKTKILVAYVSVFRLCMTRANPTSVIIPQRIAMENNCFTTLSCGVKTFKMGTFSYLLLEKTNIPSKHHNHKNKQQWKNNIKCNNNLISE